MPEKLTHLVYLNDERDSADSFAALAALHSLSVHVVSNSLEVGGAIEAHPVSHVLIDWQLSAVPRVDFTRVKWPYAALKNYVMENRSTGEAWDFMRKPTGVSAELATQLKELSKQVKFDLSERDGLEAARQVLERYPRVKVTVLTAARPGPEESPR